MRLGVVILPELRRAELAAAALAAERIRLGPLVVSPNFRHPVAFAREAIALDDLSGGRLVLGIGAGGTGWDATILGQAPWSPRDRAERFEEFVTLTDRLLREPATSWAGRHYAAHEARSHPGCVQQPRIPFAVAATGPRGMRLAAQYGESWVTTGDRQHEGLSAAGGVRVIAKQSARLDEACAAAGRDPRTLARMVLCGVCLRAGLDSVESFRETLGRYGELGVADLIVHWPRPSEPFAGDLARFERVISAARAA